MMEVMETSVTKLWCWPLREISEFGSQFAGLSEFDPLITVACGVNLMYQFGKDDECGVGIFQDL